MDYIRSISSAIFTVFAYQSFGLASLVSLIPLFSIKKNIIRHYWLWGLIYMGCLHLFFLELRTVSSIPLAIFLWLLPTFYYSFFYGLLGLIIKFSSKKSNNILIIPISFFIIETLKNIGTFANPLGNIGYSLAPYTNIIQSFSLIGSQGIGILIILINLIVLKLIYKKSNKNNWRILSLCLVILLFGNGNFKNTPTKEIKTSIIHTKINQMKKNDKRYWKNHEKLYLDLIKSSPESLIVLPESIIPKLIEYSSFYQELKFITKKDNKSILFGTHLKKQNNFFNGSILLSNEIPHYYFKEQLMPFGEYLPFRFIMAPLIPSKLNFNDFTKGKNNVLTVFNDISISQKICLEGIYSFRSIAPIPDITIIMANNGWFNESSASKKFIQFIQANSAEIGRPSIISSNYGQSAIINHKGKITSISAKNNHDILTETIEIPSNKTFYSKFPYTLIFLILIIFLFIETKPKNLTA